MFEAVKSESPLVRVGLAARLGSGAGGAGVVVGERAFLGYLNLQGDTSDQRLAVAVRDVLGVAPPQTPNTVVEAQGNSCFWLGPTEWLLVTSYQLRAEMERLLRAALTGVRSAVTDVSGGQTTIILRGRSARDVLAKGCPLDLHPRIFAVGQCAQSHLAKAPILLRMVDIAPAFEVVVRRSFADYVWLWIQDAASEYGVEIVA